MGLKSLNRLTPTPSKEVPIEIVELTRTSVLENLQADYYHNVDDHVKSAIDLHKKVAESYPNFYYELFTDPAFTDYFLDAHKAMSMPYLLYHHDESALDTVMENLKNIQVNRIGQAYEVCRMASLFGIEVPKPVLRELFYRQAEYIEQAKGVDYVGFLAVKYARELKKIFAILRVKKEKLSVGWQEAMLWVFDRDTGASYRSKSINEAVKLRKYVQEGKKMSRAPRVENIPFTVWRGYAKQLGLSEEQIFKNYKLMTNNEVKRNLATLQKYGILNRSEDRRKIEKKVDRVELDLMSLLYALKVLDNWGKKVLMEKGQGEYDKQVDNMKSLIGDKKVNVAIDCSMGGAGHAHFLEPEMHKRLANGESVPKWASIVTRESFNANVVLGKIISDSAKSAKVYLFNDTVAEFDAITRIDFEQLVEELKESVPDGGSNILQATEFAVKGDPDMAFVITDMNENVPFQGALRSQIEKIATEFNGILVFIVTETIVEKNLSTMIDDIIKDKKLHNIYVIPVKKVGHLVKGFKIVELIDRAKKLFIKVRTKNKKKKKKEVA